MAPSAPARSRLTFLDAVRGVAIILMVLNHTSRDWMDGPMTWPRYYLIYGSLLYPASMFLFLAGFCLPIAYRRSASPPPPAALALGAFRRGIVIVAGGYFLNVLISWDKPLTNGGVLQTIGLAVILLGAALPLLRHRWAQWGFLALAAFLYATFMLAVPAIKAWAQASPVLSLAFFNDFPPWPWLAAAMIGLVLGWWWLDARAQGTEAEIRFFTRFAWAGAVCLAAYAAWEWWIPTTPRFGFPRDFSVNSHWTPRGVSLLLIGGGIAVVLAAAYWLLERRRWRADWLVVLGQNALMLYFVHQVIELTIVNKLLGLRFNAWPVYWTANVLFLVLLLVLARAWQEIKARNRMRRTPAIGTA